MKEVTIYYLRGQGWHLDWTKNNGESGTQEFRLFSELSAYVEGQLFGEM